MNATVTHLSERRSPIRFHRLSDEYGAFTNFSRHPIIMDAIEWPTCEHYFQAAKFTDGAHVLRIREAPSPSRAAALGRTRSVPVRADWDRVRVGVMRAAVRAKFVQHPRLAHILLSTGARLLIETTPSDSFWGTGDDGTGLNVNGRILTEIRSELRTSTGWYPASLRHRRWVAFGASTIVLPRRSRSHTRVPAARALELLQRCAIATRLNLGIETAPDPHLSIDVGGFGDVRLRIPTASKEEDVVAALARAVLETITAVHDPRWPRPLT